MYRCLAVLSVCVSACSTMNIACEWYPSSDYRDVAMECSGTRVTRLPTMLSKRLELLRLTSTAISSLDNATFQGRALPELTTLRVAGGALSSVGAHAFCQLPSLTNLDLSHSQLDRVDTLSFSCNKRLRTVNLSSNPSLHQLPTLVSSSIEAMYIENCSLASIAVAAVERMKALKTLSLSGNQNLHCPSVKTLFEQSRPDILVICDDPEENLHPQSTFTVRQSTPLSTLSQTESVTHPPQKDGTESSASHLSKSEWALVAVSIFFVHIQSVFYYV